MINLFEYQNKAQLTEKFDKLEQFLDDIWQHREKNPYFYTEDDNRSEQQQFLQFLHRTHEIKSNKYVGLIIFENQKINLLPKIFYDPAHQYTPNDIKAIHSHILWYLSYCRKIKFPSYLTTLGTAKDDFFEILIYLFTRYTHNLLQNSIFQHYQQVHSQLPYIKGRFDINQYSRNLGSGQWHKLPVIYDNFVMDNDFNRILKYVTKLLYHSSQNAENKRLLSEILFVLDEVDETKAQPHKCKSIRFNPMFAEFETVQAYCRLFLEHSISFNYKDKLRVFAFLLPMEYVFEDFIFGFIKRELPQIKARAQVSRISLDEQGIFTLRPDILLTANGQKFIADTKYKVIYNSQSDPTAGISQNDLYQMVGYAIRFGVTKIFLLYPETIQTPKLNHRHITISDKLADGRKIQILAAQVPMINRRLFEHNLTIKQLKNQALSLNFEDLKQKLSKRLNQLFFNTFNKPI